MMEGSINSRVDVSEPRDFSRTLTHGETCDVTLRKPEMLGAYCSYNENEILISCIAFKAHLKIHLLQCK